MQVILNEDIKIILLGKVYHILNHIMCHNLYDSLFSLNSNVIIKDLICKCIFIIIKYQYFINIW